MKIQKKLREYRGKPCSFHADAKKKEKKKRIMCCCLLGDPSEKINVQRKQKDGNIKEVPSPIIGQMYNKFNYAARGHCHPGFTAQRGKNNWHQPIRSCCCLLLTN